jgi:hypothetical protein
MPNTLIPIQTYTLTTTAASITFSNIPQNYTDLKVVASLRGNSTQNWGDITFNGGGTAISMRHLLNNGGSVISQAYSPLRFQCNTDSHTAGTFSSAQMYITNYTSSTSKPISMDGTQENFSSTVGQHIAAGLWASSSAITSITITPDGGGTFIAGSTVTLYGISNGVKATGGTLTVAGGYAYHTFTSTGSFLPSQKITGAELLLVAGGGGGGGDAGGGGGAGGVVYASSQTLNAGNTYTALVGSGGAGGNGTSGVKGSASQFSITSAEGGGWGARGLGDSSTAANGGSGGGGSGRGQASGVNPAGGTATSGQGNNGGSGFGESTTGNQSGGGGGGAGGVGANSSSAVGGSGGVGTTAYTNWHSITGTGVYSAPFYYIAGGGGGSVYSGGAMGSGGTGGGGGAGNGGTAGTANTGGGGGATRVGYSGAAGGSGLIIIRYPLS